MKPQATSPSPSESSKAQAEKATDSIQLNIVIFVDVDKALRNNSADGCVYMMDTNPNSLGQGTPHLQTMSTGGQVLNWIIYAMNSNQLPDGTWPSSVRVNGIVFVQEDQLETENVKVCEELKIYGGPDRIRSKYTPIYYYWAGTISSNIPCAKYRYRLVLELDPADPSLKSVYVNFDGPSIIVNPNNKTQ